MRHLSVQSPPAKGPAKRCERRPTGGGSSCARLLDAPNQKSPPSVRVLLYLPQVVSSGFLRCATQLPMALTAYWAGAVVGGAAAQRRSQRGAHPPPAGSPN